MVQTDDDNKTNAAAAADDDDDEGDGDGDNIKQSADGETLNVAETKADDSESFCFVDDRPADSTEQATSQPPADTETKDEQREQIEEPESKMETAPGEAAVVETQSTASVDDPDSLLPSIRLVIGELSHTQ